MTCNPETTAASAAFSAGTKFQFCRRPSRERNRQNSPAWPDRPGEREFADYCEMVELVGFNLFARGQHSSAMGRSNVGPSFFTSAGARLMVVLPSEICSRICQRGRDAVARFLHGGVGQSDDDDERVAVAGVDLDLDGIRLRCR